MSILGHFPGIRLARGSSHLFAPGDEIRPKLDDPIPEPPKKRKPRERKKATPEDAVAKPKRSRKKADVVDAAQLELTPPASTSTVSAFPLGNEPTDVNVLPLNEASLTAEDLVMHESFVYDDLPFEALSTNHPKEPIRPPAAPVDAAPTRRLSSPEAGEPNPDDFLWYEDL